MSQRSALMLGGTTIVLSLAGGALAAFGPAVYTYPPPATMPTGSVSLWSSGAPVQLYAFVLVVAAAALAVAMGAYLRAAHVGGGLPIVWIATLVLVATTAVTLPGNSTFVTPASLAAGIPDAVGIGIYLVPAAIAALVTAIACGVSSGQSVATSEYGRGY